MPFNGSNGTYTLSDTIAPATLADANELQAILDDIATALTATFCKDGQSTLSAQVKGFDGTVGAPGYSFSGDSDSGLYRIGANHLGLALAGAKVVDYATTGIAVTGTFNASGAGTFSTTLGITGVATFTAVPVFSSGIAAATATTQTTLDNSTKVATTAYVDGQSKVVRTAKTGTYAILAADFGQWIDATSNTWTLTIDPTLGAGFWFLFSNTGSGAITATPASGTIDGLASFKVYPGEKRLIQSDNTNLHSVVLSEMALAITATGATTFTIPPGYGSFRIILGGAGGGGGGGSRAATNTIAAGGGGGGGGYIADCVYKASELGTSQTVTIGAGGTGGAGATSNGNAGSVGVAGGNSTLGTLLTAFGGGGSGIRDTTHGGGGGGGGGPWTAGGSPGTGTGGSNGGTSDFSTGGADGGSALTNITVSGGGGSAGGASTTAAVAGVSTASILGGGGGGGGGGGTSSGNAGTAGGNGGRALGTITAPAGGSAGANNGTAATLDSSGHPSAGGGGGGGGGGNSGSIGGNGGVGISGGGGGGGGSGNAANAGTGGTGGDGFCYIIGIS